MDLATSEKIKFELRLRFGSVFKFEDAAKLPRKSVSDFLRGRTNQRVADAIEDALTTSPDVQSDKSDDSSRFTDLHRKTGGRGVSQ